MIEISLVVFAQEMEFHAFFEGYGPLLKFLTVKLLLSLAYFQKGCVYVLQTVNRFYMFYSSLILYECVLGVFLHWFAWPSDEIFYEEDEKDIEGAGASDPERRPLLEKA
ncbi:hypothetical protein AK812_SmicGene26264 [Symbiodinium microadriaticum]|uniref:Uncharacterized protein n=1 Tax=Symbiodinium microadriaticum TaxID=2951 RepID=A0A1Q9DA06_SYMMI|nr:hypothetical protein AK812_SmicGene26264 [Symbiodinium microadriaticum]